MNNTDLVKIHHADYQEDIPFWISWTNNHQPILEIGCGHGRVVIPLIEMGQKVVGVDIDLPALESLREELGKKDQDTQKRAQIIHQDIIDYQAADRFGAVIIPCNTYSTFPSNIRQMILSKSFDLLTPGGVFAASMPNPSLLQGIFEDLQGNIEQDGADPETTFSHPDTGYPVQVSSSLSAKDISLGWDWIYDHLQPDGTVDRFVRSTEHYLTPYETYLQELKGSGFTEIWAMGDFDSSQYSEDSPYLILTGKKPGN